MDNFTYNPNGYTNLVALRKALDSRRLDEKAFVKDKIATPPVKKPKTRPKGK